MKNNTLKQAFLLSIGFVLLSNSNPYNARPVIGKTRTNGTSNFPVHKGNSVRKIIIDSKRFTFGELRSGDCVMAAGGTLDVFSDGHAAFTATVWTNHTHSGDTWHHHVFFK